MNTLAIDAMTTSTATLKSIRTLPDDSKALFAKILIDGDLALRSDYEGRPGWDDLVENDLVNCWDDDEGIGYCEIGHQA